MKLCQLLTKIDNGTPFITENTMLLEYSVVFNQTDINLLDLLHG